VATSSQLMVDRRLEMLNIESTTANTKMSTKDAYTRYV